MSASPKKSIYITTAIDYPNGKPHIGHAYEKLLADTYARWHRFVGHKVFFLTGTDENGQKLQRTAQKLSFSDTQSFVDKYSQYFRDFAEQIEITHDDFIRTTQPRHVKTVQQFWHKLLANEDIYLGEYQGWYCYGCEQFIPENQLDKEKNCPIHHTKTTYLTETGYFFKTSRYLDSILAHIKSDPHFIFPASARDEILSRLTSQELLDLPISRHSVGWGIEVPAPPPDQDSRDCLGANSTEKKPQKYVIYTWFDALINYYSALQPPDTPSYRPSGNGVWPCDVHFIGKDITWFHTVIWPCMLMSFGLPLPRRIHVHGMVLDGGGKKMSKSLGNIICPIEVLKHYPIDTLRYTFLRSIPSGKDGKFSWEMLRRRHNSELANDLGNLVSRSLKLTLKKLPGVISSNTSSNTPYTLSPPGYRGDKNSTKDRGQNTGESHAGFISYKALLEDLSGHMGQFQHHRALDLLFSEINKVNIYLNERKPWSLAEGSDELHQVLYTVVHQIYILSLGLYPFLPQSSQQILRYLRASSSPQLADPEAAQEAAKNTRSDDQRRPSADHPAEITADIKLDRPYFHLHDPQPLFAKVHFNGDNEVTSQVDSS